MSQTSSAKRPLTTLQKSTKKKVTVRLKNEVEYKGKMDNVDSYMNLIMTDAWSRIPGVTHEQHPVREVRIDLRDPEPVQ